MAILGDVEVKVSTDVMVAQADEVSRLVADMKNQFNAISQFVTATKGYWIGEAGELHRSLYEKEKDDIALMLNRLSEHPGDLKAMAANYVSAENTNIETAQMLDVDIIQ